MMKSHGAVTVGKDIVEAFVLANYMEENAYRQYMALQIGKPYVVQRGRDCAVPREAVEREPLQAHLGSFPREARLIGMVEASAPLCARRRHGLARHALALADAAQLLVRQHGLAGTYVPLAIRPEGLAAALRALHPLGFAGCNLTIPHKQKAMTIVDEVDAVARRIGAISCVTVRPDGSLAGTNNDCFGFIHNLKQEQPGWRADAGPVVVLGAGGGRARCATR